MNPRSFRAAAALVALLASSSAVAQPINDDCAGAETIPSAGPFPYATAITNVTAATAGSDPVPSCQSTVSNGVWYTFTPATSGTYSFSTCATPLAGLGSNTLADTVISVHTSASACTGPFTQLPGSAGCDDNSCITTGASGNQSVTHSPLVAGTTYYILVQQGAVGAPVAGANSVQLRVGLAGQNDVCSSAQAVSVNTNTHGSLQGHANDYQIGPACFSGVGQTSSATASGRDVVYSFTAPATGRYSFRVHRWDHETPDPVLYLSSSCPTGTAPNTFTSGCVAANRTTTGTHAEEVSCQLMTAGDTLFAYVDEVTQTTDGTPFFLEISTCVPEVEQNGTPATASPLACGSTGSIDPAGDIDFYDIGIPAPGYRVFAISDTLAGNSKDVDLRVTTSTSTLEYDANDNDLIMGGTAGNIAGTPLTQVPTFLRVNSASTTVTEPYRLYSVVRPPIGSATLETEPNNSLLSPNPVATAGYYSAVLSTATDVDVYAFSGTAGDVALISVDGDPLRNATPLNVALTLHDPQGNRLMAVNDPRDTSNTSTGTGLAVSNPTSPGEAIVVRLPSTGMYFVTVEGGATTVNVGDYLLSINLNCAPHGLSPTATSLAPAIGSPAGGTTVTITGTNFEGPAAVTFDGVMATSVTVVNSTTITAVTPAHAAGTVDVVVFNANAQRSKLTAAFTYATPPAITDVTPTSGPTAGGTNITLTGTNFASGATVTIGGAPATNVVVVSATQITATTPAGASGPANVIVTNPGGIASAPATFTYADAPTITSVAPTSGPAAGNTTITITGQNFVSGATVTVGGVAATSVVVTGGTTITAKTPAHAPGLVDIVVTNPNGQSVTLTNAFTYVAAPVATSISPTSGSTLGGATFTITGTDFTTGATVSFGGTAATNVTVVDPTSITGTTPARAAGVVNVVVTNPDGQTSTLANAFTFIAPPVLNTVTPSTGPTAGGTNVTLTGTGFVSGATVTFGGAAASNVTIVSATSITATTPAGTDGAQDVVVTNPDGQSSTLTGGFTYLAPPSITSISPTSGPTAGGTLVTVTGDKFRNGAVVVIGTKTVAATVVSATELTFTTPSHSADVVDVTVRNSDNQSATLTDAFTFLAPPTVISVTPTRGGEGGGTMVTITGTAFQMGATVTFGGTAATSVTFDDAETLVAVTPAHAPGFVDIVVTNPDNQSATLFQSFEFLAAPTLSSLTPTSGSAAGGTQVTLTGSGFQTGATVQFGEVVATAVVVESATTLIATTPVHPAGTVDVKVTNPDGQSAQLDDAFTFDPVAPTLTLVTPAQGPGEGGTPVLLAGSGFLPGATVTFGGVLATDIVVVNVNSITARTPPHEQGEVDVVVTNPDMTLATLPAGFRYTSSPDAGAPDAGVDAGTPDAGATDGGNVDYDGGSTGCGCTSTDASSLMGFALVALGSLFSRRRSRASKK